MTHEERISNLQTMLGEDVDSEILSIYLRQATEKILNHRYPYGTAIVEVEPRYEEQLLELTIVLWNKRGAEGQERHNENGVHRTWRTEEEILKTIPQMADWFV